MWLRKVKHSGSGLSSGAVPRTEGLRGDVWPRAESPEAAAELLSGQICSPVQWERIIRNLTAEGVDTFIEIGPGKTLCGMIRRISPEARAVSVTEYLAEVEAC